MTEGDSRGREQRPTSETSRREDTRHLVRASAIVSGMGLLTKGLGFVRAPVEAAVFGADRAMDALNLARQIPSAFSTWIEGPIRAGIVPLFTKSLHESGEDVAWAEASNILNTLFVGLVLVCGVLMLVSGPLVRVVGIGFDDSEAWALATTLAWIMVPSILFSVLAVVLGSLQNVYRRQLFPALGRFANGLALLLAALLLAPRFGQVGYAWGFLAGAVLAFLLQATLLWTKRRHYRWILKPLAPEIRALLLVSLPIFIGLAGTRLDAFIDLVFASFLPEGHLSVRIYSEMLALQATDLMLIISQAVMLPHFAHLVSEGRFEALRSRLVQISSVYVLFMLPITVVLCVGAETIVELIFRNGRFTAENASVASMLIPVVAIAAPVYLVGQLFAQAHVSAGNTKIPMWIGFARLAFKLALSLALIRPLGILGLVISSSLATFFRTTLLWWKLPNEYRPGAGALGAVIGRPLACALPAAALGWLAMREVLAQRGDWLGEAGALAALILIALVFQWGGGLLTRDPVVRKVLDRVRRRS